MNITSIMQFFAILILVAFCLSFFSLTFGFLTKPIPSFGDCPSFISSQTKGNSLLHVERLGGFGEDLVEKVDKALINSSSKQEISEEDIKDLLSQLSLTIRVVENDLRELKYYEKALSQLSTGQSVVLLSDEEDAKSLKKTLEAIARAFSTGGKNDFPALSMAVGFSGNPYRKH